MILTSMETECGNLNKLGNPASFDSVSCRGVTAPARFHCPLLMVKNNVGKGR